MDALDFVNFVSGQMGWGKETDVADLTDDGDKILIMTNVIISSMQNDKVWPELRRESWININPARTSLGTVDINYGDTTVTVVGDTPFVSGDVGGLLQLGTPVLDDLLAIESVTTQAPYYRIKTVTSSSVVELEMPWKDDDDTGLGIVIAQDAYELPSGLDYLLSGSLRNLSTGTEPVEVSPTEMRAVKTRDGLKLVEEEPQHFTIHGRSSGGNKVLHVDKVSDRKYTLEYEYQIEHAELTSSTDEIQYPDKYIMYIADSVIAKLQRDVENQAQAVQTAQDALRGATRVGANPNNSRDRVRMRVNATKHGAYRRR